MDSPLEPTLRLTRLAFRLTRLPAARRPFAIARPAKDGAEGLALARPAVAAPIIAFPASAPSFDEDPLLARVLARSCFDLAKPNSLLALAL